jgi:hypothetical protein
VPKHIQTSQFSASESALVSDSIVPSMTYIKPPDPAEEIFEPPCRSTYDPHEGGTQELRLSHTSAFTQPPYTFLFPHPSLSAHGTSVPPWEFSQPTDVDRNPRLPGEALDLTQAGTDAGPSSHRNIEEQADAADETRGFRETGLPLEVQRAMRDLVRKIRESTFFVNQALEPFLGTLEANALMKVAPSELWIGYGTKGRSIYSLFIKVDGDDYECLWCGDVQHDKPLRAIGHFRTKHLCHKPFTCDLTHADGKPW